MLFPLPQIHLTHLRCFPLAFAHHLPKPCLLCAECTSSFSKGAWTVIEGLGKLLSFPPGIEMHLDQCFQPSSIFASLTFFQCPCKPHLEMLFAQTLHSKYRLAFLNHLPQTSCPQAALFVVFVKEA